MICRWCFTRRCACSPPLPSYRESASRCVLNTLCSKVTRTSVSASASCCLHNEFEYPSSEVLCWPVVSHEPLVAAAVFVALRRYLTGIIRRLQISIRFTLEATYLEAACFPRYCNADCLLQLLLPSLCPSAHPHTHSHVPCTPEDGGRPRHCPAWHHRADHPTPAAL